MPAENRCGGGRLQETDERFRRLLIPRFSQHHRALCNRRVRFWRQLPPLPGLPEARFRIVGRNPVRRVEKWASESIEVTGRVPSVVEHLRESAVVIVPLRIGGGTRLKIYEAMAAAKAVVSTTVGAEGLDIHPGRDIILADDARAFSQAVIMLLRDRELRRRYEKAAAETAARYDWPAIGERFGEVLQAVAEKKFDTTGAVTARTA